MKGKTIVLTGASGGIGSDIAKQLSDAGARLLLVGRNTEKLDTLNKGLESKHRVITADITTETGRNKVVQACEGQKQGIDVLINNAGIGQFNLFEEMGQDQIGQIIHTNLTSTILLTHALLPLLLAQQKAKIINIGSTFGSIGYPGSSVYSASKFGVRGFSEALRRELMGNKSQIRVQYFAPRATKTSINNAYVDAMNQELGTHMDDTTSVAKQLLVFMKTDAGQCFIGWPEKLFVRINGLLPSVVESSIVKQLPVIKRYLKQSQQ
ncbi:MAG TPA: SDR family oxidoreductase [Cycloclasticus sp.]|jgi:short-subunit dehydrogenase|nr:SDR family oxidoreductase [Cycloclasticus sp.]